MTAPVLSTLAAGLAAATAAGAQEPAELRGLGYVQGDSAATVTVVEFADFGCPACAEFARETYPRLYEEFVRSGKVRWRYIPFVLGVFRNAEEAARAAECAGAQGAFWSMHDRLYAEHGRWTKSRKPGEVFREYARELGLDEARFASCYREGRGRERTEANNRAATRLGVRGTPTFFVNGRRIEGALPFEPFRALLVRRLGGP